MLMSDVTEGFVYARSYQLPYTVDLVRRVNLAQYDTATVFKFILPPNATHGSLPT